MDYSKHGNSSEASSDENEQNSPEKLNDNTGTGRSYECSFCKRGFTNAQALGGHMNIHRKDKAKVKAKPKTTQTTSFSTNKSFNEDYMSSSRYFAPISNEQAHYHAHATLGAGMNYHQFYHPASNSNPNYPPHAYYQSDLISTRHVENFGLHEDHLGANLSLEVGSSHIEDVKGKNRNVREDGIEHEVDLELRLGYDP